MTKYTLLACFLLLTTLLPAQFIWTGGGDGTSWNDAANWDNEAVPTTDSLVIINKDVTITGVAPAAPLGLRVNGKSSVVLDLDLTLGNPDGDQHVISVGDTCQLQFGVAGNNRTFTINAPDDKHCIAVFGGAESVSITIAESATVDLRSGLSGINLANALSSVNNDGNIVISDAFTDGIRVVGNFSNNGSITGGAVGKDLINVKTGGILTNSASGTITSNKAGDDGIELVTDASFVNDGELMLIAPDSAGSANSAIAVGANMSAGSFINNGQSVTLVGGADGSAGRGLSVLAMGNMVNNGTITITGGNDGARLNILGEAENGIGGIIDLVDGRFVVNSSGSFVNNGLIKTTREGSGGFVSGMATNNAFFDYASANLFAVGANGTIVDKGISLNNRDTIINARKDCTFDVGNAPYEFFLDGVSVGMASDTGAFSFADGSLMVDSVLLTTIIPGINIKVRNICEAALQTNGLFSAPFTADVIKAFPNPLATGETLMLDLSDLPAQTIRFSIFDAFGREMNPLQLAGGRTVTVDTVSWPAGTYTLRTVNDGRIYVSRVVLMK